MFFPANHAFEDYVYSSLFINYIINYSTIITTNMSPNTLPSRPRIIASMAHKYIGKQVSVIGELTSINTNVNTLTLRLPDDETMIVLMSPRNPTHVEPYLLTEVAGKLVSRGQIEASLIKQWNAKETGIFNKSNYVETIKILEGLRNEYDV